MSVSDVAFVLGFCCFVIEELIDFLFYDFEACAALLRFRAMKTMHAVPINIFPSPVRIDMVAVIHVEAAVIVPWIVDTIFSGTAIVPCQCISYFSFPPFTSFKNPAAKPLTLPFSAVGNTQY